MRILHLALIALGGALVAAPAVADIVLPLSIGDVTFAGFQDSSANPLSAGCSSTFAALGSASCNGSVVYGGGPLGPGLHVTGATSGNGTTLGGANPTATASLDVSGGDAFSGVGLASVTTQLQYYVTVVPLGELATHGLRIPLDYFDAGSIGGVASSTILIRGDAKTRLHAFEGSLVIDGSDSSINHEVENSVTGGLLTGSYGGSHSVLFDFSEGDTVAEVDLRASCVFSSQAVGFGTANCQASADPFFGFDQAAFDAEMGANTFTLSDFFQIEVSPGLAPGAGVPEPTGWALMIVGSGLAGAAARRRRRLADIWAPTSATPPRGP
jgi:hypothetical protein